jgi:hypothetical protein
MGGLAGLPCVLARKPLIYALSVENVRNNRPILLPNPLVAAKNCRNYGYGAMLRATLIKSRKRGKLEKCKNKWPLAMWNTGRASG